MIRVCALLAIMATPATADTLRIGTNADYPPYIAQDGGGTRYGLDADLADAICTMGGFDCVWVDLSIPALLDALQTGQVDIVMGGIGYSVARDAVVDFTCPYFATFGATGWLYTRGYNDDLDDPLVVVTRLSLHEVAAQEAGYRTLPFPDSRTALNAFLAGQGDAFFGSPEMVGTTPAASDLIPRDTLPTPTAGAAIAVSEDDPDLRDQIDGYLAELSADGRLGQMQMKWMMEDQGDVIAECRKPDMMS